MIMYIDIVYNYTNFYKIINSCPQMLIYYLELTHTLINIYCCCYLINVKLFLLLLINISSLYKNTKILVLWVQTSTQINPTKSHIINPY